jgi:hypothetical protein
MKFLAALALCVTIVRAGDTLQVFGRQWEVPFGSDWHVDRAGGSEILQLIKGREPAPGPRRPAQFALTEVPPYRSLTVEADVRPEARSLMIVFAYRDAAHFDYAHLSSDTAAKQPVHNGIFHVYGGERVRISAEDGPASFPETRRWYHIVLTHDAVQRTVAVTVDGLPVPALRATDLSLGAGKIGLGSFDETADFKNLKIKLAGSPESQ